MRRLLLVLMVLPLAFLAACAGSDDASDAADGSAAGSVVAADGSVRWGDGDYGVVLAHGAAFDAASWEPQATRIAEQGATVLAVEDISTEAIRDAVETLQEEGHPEVALVGGSAGADAILQLAAQDPGLGDQIILLSPNGVVEGLGVQPKLFIASEDEPVADVSTELAEGAPGDNEALILPGSDHAQNIFTGDHADEALTAILDRLAR